MLPICLAVKIMRIFSRLTICLLPALLTACATFQEPSVNPPENSNAVLRLDASGEQVFRCVHDMKGWFWRFEAPNAYLLIPKPVRLSPSTVTVSHLFITTALKSLPPVLPVSLREMARIYLMHFLPSPLRPAAELS